MSIKLEVELTESEFSWIERMAILNGKQLSDFIKQKIFFDPECHVATVDDSLCGFDEFWNCYPRKVNKGQAKRIWKRLKVNSEFLKLILATLEKQKSCEQWKKDNGKFIPHPSTWLNAEGWENQLESNDVFEEFANG